MKLLIKSFVVVALALSVSAALGQNNGGGGGSRGGRGGRTRGDNRGDNRGMGSQDPSQRNAWMEDMLRRMDANKNGMIDAEEVSDRRRYMVEGMLSRAGIEPKYPLAISQIVETMSSSARNGGGPASSRNGSSAGNSSGGPSGLGFGDAKSSPPGVLGFGQSSSTTTKSALIPGPASPAGASAAAAASSASSPAGSNAAAPDLSIDQKIRNLAAFLIQKYDKNSDGKLDRDEWPSQGKWGTFSEANRSGGTSVSLADLIAHLTDYVHRQQLSLDSLDAGSSETAGSLRKSGRFLLPRERLPKGLPDWFLRKDVDGDGQVSMAEYASDWNPAATAEFDRYDLNHDGVVTAAECLKAEKRAAVSSR